MTGKELALVAEALALPPSSRVEIIKALTDSLLEDASEAEIQKLRFEEAWYLEANSRMAGFERGDLEAFPGEEVMGDLRSRKGH